MNEPKSFGYLVRRLRKAIDLTQRELAERVSCSREMIDKIEREERRPSRQIAARLAIHFQLPSETYDLFVRCARGEIGAERVLQSLTLAVPLPRMLLSSPPVTNLPTPTTSCVGRSQESSVVCDLLRSSTVRLVTLSGTGGIGKTRLALEVASTLLKEFVDGVWYVELAAVHHPSLVLGTIAQVLDVDQAPWNRIEQRVIATLRHKQLLLVLDNFEHLLEAAPTISVLLQAVPQLKVLVTSRSALHLSGEHEFVVPPLTVVAPNADASTPLLTEVPAIELFLQRARAATAGFSVTDQSVLTIAEICRRLDGIPLAIELAAVRVKLLPPAELLSRLESRLELLTGGPHDLPLRQRTLRHTLDWSYNLLRERERELFRQLSVFAGGCTLEAAEVVCGNALPDNLLDTLQSLINQSMVNYVEQRDGQPRFTMLETVREYAQERLLASGQYEDLRQRHFAHYLAVAEQAAPQLRGPRQAVLVKELEHDHNNLRAALTWALEHKNVSVALRLGTALEEFWRLHGHGHEGRDWLERALMLDPLGPSALLADAMAATGGLAHNAGDLAAAIKWHRLALGQYRTLDNKRGIAESLSKLGAVTQSQYRFRRSEVLCRCGLALFRHLEDERGIALAAGRLAWTTLFVGSLTEARTLAEESLHRCRRLGDTAYIASALSNLGITTLFQGDPVQARRLFEESLGLQRKLENPWGISENLMQLGWALLLGPEPCHATSRFQESLRIQLNLRDLNTIAYCLEGYGSAAMRCSQQAERTAFLAGAAAAIRAQLGIRRRPPEQALEDQLVAEGHAQIGKQAWDTAWRAGHYAELGEVIRDVVGSDPSKSTQRVG